MPPPMNPMFRLPPPGMPGMMPPFGMPMPGMIPPPPPPTGPGGIAPLMS
jgi:hypothetical protein